MEISKKLKGKTVSMIKVMKEDKTIKRIYFTDGTYLLLYGGVDGQVFVYLYDEFGNEIAK